MASSPPLFVFFRMQILVCAETISSAEAVRSTGRMAPSSHSRRRRRGGSLPVFPTQALAAAVQSQLDQSRGRLEQFGSEAELSAKKQALAQRLDTLNERREALTLARQTLAQANAALAERFSPRLVREASEIFSELTGGRYARVQISRQMELEAGQPDAAMRRSLFLSGGTADELYLSVRLAVCRLLLPEDAPLLLDDALVMFDDDRLRLALRLLQREAENRQILLFTCQHREQKALTTDL